MLFIFPTRVSLDTITLHYYSDSVRSLPGLKFYAVPDEYNVWQSPSGSYISVHVGVTGLSPVKEPVGRRNISIDVKFNTKTVLIYMQVALFSLQLVRLNSTSPIRVNGNYNHYLKNG